MSTKNDWSNVPDELKYLEPWVEDYGLIGRTVFLDDPLQRRQLSPADLLRLAEAYLLIEKHDDFDRIGN